MLQVMKAIMLNHKEKFFFKKCYNYVKPVPPQKLPYCEKYRYNKWNISISDLASLAMNASLTSFDLRDPMYIKVDSKTLESSTRTAFALKSS